MKPADPIDAGRLTLALNELRLPAIKTIWPDFAVRADKEGWPAARFLAALTEHELAERSSRRIQRHLEEARLPPGKTLDSFEFDAVPTVSKAQVVVRHKLAQVAPAKLRTVRQRNCAGCAVALHQHHAQFGGRPTAELCFIINRPR